MSTCCFALTLAAFLGIASTIFTNRARPVLGAVHNQAKMVCQDHLGCRLPYWPASVTPSLCLSNRHCKRGECCIKHSGYFYGFCSKRPGLGESCKASLKQTGCPCVVGTTCGLKRDTRSWDLRGKKFICIAIAKEVPEVSE